MVLTSGTRLGPYEIQAPLGAGGMGEVYRAHDGKLGRDVAVKVLPEALASDPEALARFEREACAVAALSHPNILAIHDIARHDGQTFAVMELLHRDLKPENLFVTGEGRLKILDFGLAKSAPVGTSADVTKSPTLWRHTEPGQVMGTVSEVVRGPIPWSEDWALVRDGIYYVMVRRQGSRA